MYIEFIDRVPTQSMLSEIYSCAHIGVFPYSAEGWNLPLCELMAMGKPCIATSYSGPTEFLNTNNSVLLNDFKMEVAFDEKWFPNRIGQWAVVNEEELIDKMIYCAENVTKLTNTLGKEAANHIAKNFTWAHTANKILEVLENL
jgi:glycosyltransferase involved in cell wall biosynthesis